MWRAGLPIGSPCTIGADCVSTICSGTTCVGRPVGAVCEEDWVCESNICTTIGLIRKCTQKRKTGEICDTNESCTSNVCKYHKCVCSLQSCVLSFSCLQGCARGSSCIESGEINPHFCGRRKANGSACRPQTPDECLSGYCSTTIHGKSYCAPKLPGNECTTLDNTLTAALLVFANNYRFMYQRFCFQDRIYNYLGHLI